jgi:hypothetical protein
MSGEPVYRRNRSRISKRRQENPNVRTGTAWDHIGYLLDSWDHMATVRTKLRFSASDKLSRAVEMAEDSWASPAVAAKRGFEVSAR